ncbi:hypothetical protein SO802_034389 [Lithocarpus litseifolius]|uniref:AP2/ERF domain-containing protein n=1 Tax=Lithocarpus litseifolius TaxID=425828 RepID=A0AAW2BFT1_9ROSI
MSTSSVVDPQDKMRARDVNKVARGEQAPRPAHEPGAVSRAPPPSQSHPSNNSNNREHKDSKDDDECDQGVAMESSKKRKSGGNGMFVSVAETLAKWRDYNAQLESSGVKVKHARKLPAMGSKKGCMKGKGGSENPFCNYRRVRQRTWGIWVAEIREPNRGKRLWLGTFDNAVDATFAYNEAARVMYGAYTRLNFPESASTIFGLTLVEFEVLLMTLLPCPVQVSLLPCLVW